MREHRRQLDISVEMSGPHDFTVRRACVRRSQSPRPPHPALNVYDDRETPLMRGGTARAYKDDLPDGQSEIFFARRLAHRANQRAGPTSAEQNRRDGALVPVTIPASPHSIAVSRPVSSVPLPQSSNIAGNWSRRDFDKTQPKGGTIGARLISATSHMARCAKCGFTRGRAGADVADGA